MTNISKEFVYGLPKAELHLHLEGTLEPELKLRLAQKNNIELKEKTVEEVEATYQFNDLTSFLAVYYPGMDVLVEKEDFYDLAMAYLKKFKSTMLNTLKYSLIRKLIQHVVLHLKHSLKVTTKQHKTLKS